MEHKAYFENYQTILDFNLHFAEMNAMDGHKTVIFRVCI